MVARPGCKGGHEQVAWKDDDWIVEAAFWRRLLPFICQDAHYEEQTGDIGMMMRMRSWKLGST